MPTKKFKARVVQDDGSTACGIELPFNPKDVFGKVRTPVSATINGFTFRTTTCSMGGSYWIPLNRQNRDGAGASAGKTVAVTLKDDTAPRTVTVPPDLAKELKKHARLREAWNALSYTHQREHAEAITGAKKAETRVRRVNKTIDALRAKADKKEAIGS